MNIIYILFLIYYSIGLLYYLYIYLTHKPIRKRQCYSILDEIDDRLEMENHDISYMNSTTKL